jgi:hypothetical protein
MLKSWTSSSVVVVLLVSGGCSGEKKADVADTSFHPPPVATAVPSSAETSRPPDEPCPHTGLWAQCSVERRLRQAGFVVNHGEEESPRRAGFSIQPLVLTLGRSRVEAFIYEDEKAVARDVAGLDTVTVTPRGAAGSWESTPTFIRSGNLIAVILSQDARQSERIALALTAGAPQPGSPR